MEEKSENIPRQKPSQPFIYKALRDFFRHFIQLLLYQIKRRETVKY